MQRPHPKAFRVDVVAVARRGDAPVSQIAKDFGIPDSCLCNWMQAADVEDGNRPGVTSSESAELRELGPSEPAAGAGGRGPASGGGLPVAGASAGELMCPLVRELAIDGIPVA